MKPEGAFYIPTEEEKKTTDVDSTASERAQGLISSAINSQRLKISNFSLKNMCDNMTLHGATEFTHRYAVGAITKIIKKEPVTNRTMLDSLFNTYAPVFNATLIKSGYNSVAAMRDAAIEGTINPSNFLAAFDSGLTAFEEEANVKSRYAIYGDEIPIDLVEECSYEYYVDAPEQKTEEGTKIDYLTQLDTIKIKVIGHVKNKNAEVWDLNDYSYKLADAMSMKKPLLLRIGRTIYDKVYLVKYEPVIKNIHEIRFMATFHYEYIIRNISSEDKKTGCRLIRNELDKKLANYTADTVYIGEGRVDKVTKKDVFLIAQAKKILGKDKILIDGEYV